MKTLTNPSIEELVEAYLTLGKEGHILTVNEKALTASLDRISKRARLGSKRVFGYRFKSLERMLEYITEHYNGKIVSAENAIKEKAARKAQNILDRETVTVGDIFCYSWGWEQTNIDFFQVTGKKGKISITVRPIHRETVQETSWGSEDCRAIANDFIGDEEETVRLSGSYFKRSCGIASKMEDPTASRHRSWYA